VHKLNFSAAIAASILILSSSSSQSANYKTTAPTYKGEIPHQHYKGEAVAKPKPAPRPVMAPIILQEGPYFGIAAGYDSYKVHKQSTVTAGTLHETRDNTINSTGILGALLAGYGHYFNNALYLGGEIFINASEATQSINAGTNDATDTYSSQTKFLVSKGYGASLLPGVKLSDSALVYLRLGYQVARLRAQENSYLNGSPFVVSNTASWNGGFAYGVGFEEAMVENFSLRGEYVHTDYRSFTSSSGGQYSPSNNQFLLALIYHIS